MINYDYIKELVGPKRPKVAEIELTLFENCDVVCSFCGHEKKSTLGMSLKEIFSKLPIIEQFLDSLDDDISRVHLHLVGGELLQDRLIDNENYLTIYGELIDAYLSLIESRGLTTQVIVVTNLLFKKPELVHKWLLERNEISSVKIIASYDPIGRPITKQYFKNLDFLQDYISNINVVVTKQTINKLIAGDTSFDFLYKNYPIFMDDFLPDKETQYMIPTDLDYLEYLRLCYHKYPKLMPYDQALNKAYDGKFLELQFTTFNKCTILPNNVMTNYLWDRHEQNDFDFPINYQDNSNLLFEFLNHFNCLSCEYYQKCPLRCPVSWAWRNETRSDICTNKLFFRELENNFSFDSQPLS